MTVTSVLVTGANGFVGGELVKHLLARGMRVHAAVRQANTAPPAAPGLTVFTEMALDEHTDWSCALKGVDAVVHCAARVHVMREQSADPLAEFRRVNVDGTRRLASQAAEAGVQRLVYVSSIGVNGAETNERAFQADDEAAPHSPYAQSKLEAELALQALQQACRLTVCIVRPPMVYGAGAPGNYASLVRALQRGWPLPLGSVRNRRSFVAIDNLVNMLALCTEHPAAAGEVFLVSDGEDLSTTDLLQRMARSQGCRAHLLPVPPALLALALRLLGKSGAGQSLLGSLRVDISKTRQRLGWAPVVGVDEALDRAAKRMASGWPLPGLAGQ